MSTLDTFLNAQSSKVGKMEKTQPAIFRRKSPNQRRYEDVRSREYLLPKEPKEVDAMLAIRVGATPGYENPARESSDG
ncbi:hypothetical protein [Scytonema sp. PRP1]|uniref:hypothetical protein n=1 Tax=Scytonema sp. PRP1 TaxID=3120513 RepID=UPI002FD3C3DE